MNEIEGAAKQCFQGLIAKTGPEALVNKKLTIFTIALILTLMSIGFSQEELEQIDPVTYPLCQEPRFLSLVKKMMCVIERVLDDEEL